MRYILKNTHEIMLGKDSVFVRVLDREEYYTYLQMFNPDIAILNVELQSDILSGGKYDNDKAIASCISVLYNNTVYTFVSETKNDAAFYAEVKKFMKNLSPITPLMAFNPTLIQKVLFNQFHLDLNIVSLKPFKMRGWGRERFLNTLNQEGAIPAIGFRKPNSRGKTVGEVVETGSSMGVYRSIDAFKEYLDTGDIALLELIGTQSTINCLKDAVIYSNLDWFLKRYKVGVDGCLIVRDKGIEPLSDIPGKIVGSVWVTRKKQVVTIEALPPNEQKARFQTFFTGRWGDMGNIKITHQNSNLGRFYAKYGQIPSFGMIVRCKRNKTGSWALELE